MDQKVCVSSFYFTFLTILMLMLGAIVIFQYSEIKHANNSCPVCPPCGSNNNANQQPTPTLPPLSPDDHDDLMVGELPPRNRDYRKLNDPLKQPSRRYVDYPSGYPGLLPIGNINIPTQGYLPSYQQMGYLSVTRGETKKNDPPEQEEKADPNRMLKLFGRRFDSHRYEYYVIHHLDESLKIPIPNKGDKELMEGDSLQVPGYPGTYKVHLYNFEGPRYIPYF